jgi:DNA-binding transcriptional ArsR family regulator
MNQSLKTMKKYNIIEISYNIRHTIPTNQFKGENMEHIINQSIATPIRKLILHFVLIRGTTYPKQITENLKISKGLPSQFLRLCTALNIVKRERCGYKVLYSINVKGMSILKRLSPEIFDRSFSGLFGSLPKKKFGTKYYPVNRIGLEIRETVDNIGGIQYKFYDSEGELISTVFKSIEGLWWCVACQSRTCRHVNYLKNYYEELKK